MAPQRQPQAHRERRTGVFDAPTGYPTRRLGDVPSAHRKRRFLRY